MDLIKYFVLPVTLALPTGGSFMVFQLSKKRLLSSPPFLALRRLKLWRPVLLPAACGVAPRPVTVSSRSPAVFGSQSPQSDKWPVRREDGGWGQSQQEEGRERLRNATRRASLSRRGERPLAGAAAAGSTFGSPGPRQSPPSEQQRRCAGTTAADTR